MAQQYDFSESLRRIDTVLASPLTNTTSETIPDKGNLNVSQTTDTFATVLHIEFELIPRPSETTPSKESAKVLYSFISEVINIVTAHETCKDIVAIGNSLTVIYDTPLRVNLNGALDDAARIRTLAFVISKKSSNLELSRINIKISMDYGSVTLLPLTSQHHSWIGEPIDRVKNLANLSQKGCIMITDKIRINLSEHNQTLFEKDDEHRDIYKGYIVNTLMSQWLEEQK